MCYVMIKENVNGFDPVKDRECKVSEHAIQRVKLKQEPNM